MGASFRQRSAVTSRLKALLPNRLKRAVRLVLLAGDVPTLGRLWRLLGTAGAREPRPAGGTESLKLRPLGGRTILVRRGSSDADVVWETFSGRYHLPPPDCRERSLRNIWDLGSNIGLTIAHLAVLYPEARIVGVELDAANAALCRSNIAPWSGRCEVRVGAVWHEEGEVSYAGPAGVEYGFSVASTGTGIAAGPAVGAAPAISLNELHAEHDGGVEVDYVKMDIEGSEREVLRSNTEWAAHVRCINVEVHDPYSVEDCRADLEALGFRTEIDTRHWACVFGIRARPD